jgi:hypothetical protein
MDKDTDKDTDKDMDKDMGKDMGKDTDKDKTRTRTWNTFLRYTYCAIVPIAQYGLTATHYCTSSNGAKNL